MSDPLLNAGDLQKTAGLSHETVSRKVPYYYCNEAELEALKSVGLIFNACLAFGTGGIFFGIPMIAGAAVLNVGGEAQPEASVFVGWISLAFSIILLAIGYVSHRSGNRLLQQLKGSR